MDRHQKQHILNHCHSNTIEVDTLDEMVVNGFISIEEFQQYNLEIAKVNDLKNRKAARENLHIPDTILAPPETSKEEESIFGRNIFGGPVIQNASSSSPQEAAINNVLAGKLTASEILSLIQQNIFNYDDLRNAGLDSKILNSLKFRGSEHRVTVFKRIEELPPMQDGRTDLYFVGVPKAGKSTMLGGLLYKMHRDGFLMPDTYNSDGTEYQTRLISDIDHGVLPARTALGSYNYLAVSLKDKDNLNHPFNIVEVPGENYERLHNGGMNKIDKKSSNGEGEKDFIKPFVNYIKNKNKKILIFVIDVFAHENRHEDHMHQALNQSLAYTNILNIFKDHGILENTDAIYLTLNKFDIVRESQRQGNDSDEQTAYKYLHEEFRSLINNCLEAKAKTKNRLKIKILPYSVGEVVYSEILKHFEPSYSQILANNLLADSFVVKGGRFWGKII